VRYRPTNRYRLVRSYEQMVQSNHSPLPLLVCQTHHRAPVDGIWALERILAALAVRLAIHQWSANQPSPNQPRHARTDNGERQPNPRERITWCK
jgi:hypothetical protein